MKKKVLIGLIIVVGIGVAVIASSGDSSTKASIAKPAVAQVNSSVSHKQEYKVGDTVDISGMKLKVDKVTIANGDEFDTPQKGNDYVVVKITIINDSDDTISYNPFDYSIKNSKGQITDGAMSSVNSNTALNSGQLAKGGSVTGTLVYEAPKGDKGLKLLYKGNVLSNDVSAQINLN